MNNYDICIENSAPQDDVQVLYRELYEFNVAQTGLSVESVSAFVRDGEGRIVGGCHGWTTLGYVHIDVLWLKEDLRRKGYGRKILEAIEGEAKRRGCKLAELETLSFQSLEFYLKNGYTIFGELEGLAG